MWSVRLIQICSVLGAVDLEATIQISILAFLHLSLYAADGSMVLLHPDPCWALVLMQMATVGWLRRVRKGLAGAGKLSSVKQCFLSALTTATNANPSSNHIFLFFRKSHRSGFITGSDHKTWCPVKWTRPGKHNPVGSKAKEQVMPTDLLLVWGQSWDPEIEGCDLVTGSG